LGADAPPKLLDMAKLYRGETQVLAIQPPITPAIVPPSKSKPVEQSDPAPPPSEKIKPKDLPDPGPSLMAKPVVEEPPQKQRSETDVQVHALTKESTSPPEKIAKVETAEISVTNDELNDAVNSTSLFEIDSLGKWRGRRR
jgi:hypothetical protein